MAKVDEFKFVFFPETDHEVKVRARRIPGVNEELFDYWIDCMPIPRTVWSPALIAGHICYSHYLEMKVPMPYTIDELYNQGKFDLWYLDESKPGICTLFNGQGKNGDFVLSVNCDFTQVSTAGKHTLQMTFPTIDTAGATAVGFWIYVPHDTCRVSPEFGDGGLASEEFSTLKEGWHYITAPVSGSTVSSIRFSIDGNAADADDFNVNGKYTFYM